MPELPVKEVRLPELHLPEIKRDDIVRALSDIPRPDVDLSKIERPKIDLPDSVGKLRWPTIDLSSVDIGKAVAGAAAAAHIGRRTRRPRWPLAVGGLIVAGLATWAILTNETVRSRLAGVASGVRERLDAMRSGDSDGLDIETDEHRGSAAETHPIEPPPYADTTAVDATGYPEGLGSHNGDGIPALEGSSSRE